MLRARSARRESSMSMSRPKSRARYSIHDALNAWGRLGTFQQVTPKSARTQPGEPVLARFEGWHQRRPPAVRFGSFVSFRVWSSVQPQNLATQDFGSFGVLDRQPATFGPRDTLRFAHTKPLHE